MQQQLQYNNFVSQLKTLSRANQQFHAILHPAAFLPPCSTAPISSVKRRPTLALVPSVSATVYPQAPVVSATTTVTTTVPTTVIFTTLRQDLILIQQVNDALTNYHMLTHHCVDNVSSNLKIIRQSVPHHRKKKIKYHQNGKNTSIWSKVLFPQKRLHSFLILQYVQKDKF